MASEDMIAAIKEMQKNDFEAKQQWIAYTQEYGEGNRDPARHADEFIQAFLDQYESGERMEVPGAGKGGKGKGKGGKAQMMMQMMQMMGGVKGKFGGKSKGKGGFRRGCKDSIEKRVWIGNLPTIEDREKKREAEEKLKVVLQKGGECKYAAIMSNGQGVATFPSEEEAQSAIEALAGTKFRGKVLEFDTWEKQETE